VLYPKRQNSELFGLILVSDTEEGTSTEGVPEQGAMNTSMWTEGERNDTRLEKTA
jgi:hypothetical protein